MADHNLLLVAARPRGRGGPANHLQPRARRPGTVPPACL